MVITILFATAIMVLGILARPVGWVAFGLGALGLLLALAGKTNLW